MVEIDLVEEESFLENSESFVGRVPANRVEEIITNSNKDIFNVPQDNLEPFGTSSAEMGRGFSGMEGMIWLKTILIES